MKKLLMLLTALIILSLILGTVSCVPSEPTGPVISIVFNQMDFNFDGTTYDNTEWGGVDFTFTGQEDIMYFNLAVDGSWQVQNIPVLSGRGVGVEQTMHYHFDLGTERGTDATSLNYDYAFTSYILDTMPGGSIPASVGDDYVELWAGIQGGLMPDLAAAKPLVGGEVSSTEKHAHKNFPNQQCGKRECAPAAVSNSLQFLNTKHKLGMKADKISIDEMKKATNWTNGAPLNWGEKKKEYMEKHKADYPITTRIIKDMSKLAAEIDAGQDVEITETWKDKNGKTSGHATALIGITKLKNGKYSLDIADDRNQGDDSKGCDKPRNYIYDPATGNFDEEGFISKFEYAVVECPEPEPLDHFKCYGALDERGPIPIGELVYLEDQFVAVNATVGWAKSFCNPVEKWHDGVETPISNPDRHLTFYNIAYQEEPQQWFVEVDNQFGTQNLTVLGPVMLAVPTQKVEPGDHEPPVDLDHFLLYAVEGPPVEPITINITAQVEAVDDPDNILGGAINVGDTITGTYTYNPATTDSNALPTVGDYRHTSSPYGITVNAGGFVFQTDPSNVDFLVEIVNDHGTPARDNYLLRSYNNLPLSNGALVEHIAWQLDDPTATALSSKALPTTPPVLTHWECIFGLTLVGHDPADPTGFDYFVGAHVTVAEAPMEVVVGLNDQFHDEPEVLVHEPVYFANPVRKTHAGIVTEIENPEAHLVFYWIEGGVFETEVQVVNQFGEQTLNVDDPTLLAVPSDKLSAEPVVPVD